MSTVEMVNVQRGVFEDVVTDLRASIAALASRVESLETTCRIQSYTIETLNGKITTLEREKED